MYRRGGRDMTKNFNPGKYKMIFCPSCSGRGYYRESRHEMDVCRMCGGFGLIKKENFGNEKKQEITRMNRDALLTL
jgi:DnaJ-class molecular chaperone